MVRRTFLARGALAALVWLTACGRPLEVASADAAGPAPVEIAARGVALDLQEVGAARVGRLIYRGGLVLSAMEPRFGGWSGLDVSADGKRLVAVSDKGYWMDARLAYDEGRLAGVAGARIGELTGLDGRPARGSWSDAEGLARAPDGGYFVSFERRPRVWFYPAAEPPFSLPPRPVPTPPGIERAPSNGGMEAIARLPGGRLLVIAEELYQDEANVGWIGDGRTWQRLTYRCAPGFKPTDAAVTPSGDVLVLERRFTRLGSLGARIVRVRAGDIRAGARLEGEVLALIEPPLTLDNFEGISARTGARGETLVYVISDDNYFFLQRTLLLMFEIEGERAE